MNVRTGDPLIIVSNLILFFFSSFSARLRSVMSRSITIPRIIFPSSSVTGKEQTLIHPFVPSPRKISISSSLTTSPVLIERDKGHS